MVSRQAPPSFGTSRGGERTVPDLRGYEMDRLRYGGQDVEEDPDYLYYSMWSTILSRDGSIVLGETATWRAEEGARAVSEVLTGACIDTARLRPSAFWFANQISADNRTITGCARTYPESDGWPAPPEIDECWIASNVDL